MDVTHSVNDVENVEDFGGGVLHRISDLLEKASSLLDWGQRLQFLLPIIIVVILFVITLFVFRHKCRRITLEQVKKYSDTGKYIKGLFVELNDSKEYIRAFCFDKLWKQRVIKRYNTLFDDKMGRELPHVYSAEKDINIKISLRSTISKAKKEIEKTKHFLQKISNRELTCNPEYMNTNMLYECFGNNYIKSIERIDQLASYLSSRYLIVTGTAGNGKTMMLCSVAEQLANANETVIFLNARDIKEDLLSHLGKKLGTEKLKKVNKLWWRIQNFLHFLMKKDIYIILDAINENTSEEFLCSFSKSVEWLLGFNHVKLIISCRSEYFDLKYQKYLLINEMEKVGCFLDLQAAEYTYEARERLLANYARHYGFTGELSETVKEKVARQLLLVRILFEVYEGKNERIFELNKYELYRKYMDGSKDRKLVDFLNQLAKHMLDNRKYENVPMIELSQFGLDCETIDSSILVRRDIIRHEGTLREEPQEVINFVYDEMRDYRLSTHILRICENEKGNVDSFKVKVQLYELINQRAVCLEGVVNYLFNFYLTENDTSMLEFLLFDVIKKRDDKIETSRSRRNKQITSWGLLLLFETSSIKSDFGKKYIDYILHDNPGMEGRRLLFYLLRQEFANGEYTLDILLYSLMRGGSSAEIANRLEHAIASWRGEGVTLNDCVDLHKKLTQVNKEGAKRLSVFMFLAIVFFNWNGKTQVENYMKKECNIEKIKEYLKSLEQTGEPV